MKAKIIALFISVSGWVSSANAQREITLNIGDEAPKLAVGRWVKGEPIETFSKGHVYILDFWATWCVPCKEGMPHMSELARTYRGKASFIAMNVSEIERPDRDIFTMVDAFVRKMGDKMDVHVAMDTKDGLIHKTWFRAAGFRGLPSVIIVDKDSKIAWTGSSGGVDSAVAAIVSGTFDRVAFAKQRKKDSGQRKPADEVMTRAYAAIQQALNGKDYPHALSLYEKAIAANSSYAKPFKGLYFPLLAHLDPDKAYQQLMTSKGSAEEYNLARSISDESGLQRRFYDYLVDFFTKRSENDFFAMGSVAKAHFNAGNVKKAIAVQRQYVKDLKLPTTPSTEGFIKMEERVLKKYEGKE